MKKQILDMTKDEIERICNQHNCVSCPLRTLSIYDAAIPVCPMDFQDMEVDVPEHVLSETNR